jgi:hypothetical protein
MGNQGDNGTGFIVGAEPATPRMANDWPTQTAAQAVSQPAVVVADNGQPTGRFFTEEDLNKARQQEKDKLYPRIDQMDQQLKALQAEREAAEAARKAEVDAAAQAAKEKEEAELSVRALLQKKEQEWNDKFQTIEQQREQDRAVYEMERRLAETENYKFARLQQDAEFILPELRDLVKGNTPNEIDASIEEMKARTDAIMGNVAGVVSQQQQPPQVYRGASPTAPPVGPMEQMSTTQRLTPEDIRSMDIETYKKYRDTLLASASQQYRGRP